VKKDALVTAALAVAVAATTAGGALAFAPKAKTVAFLGAYAGAASVKVTGNVAAISASGAGKGTLVGTSKISGKGVGDTSVQPCATWKGMGAIVGTGGKINLVVSAANACPNEDQSQAAVSGTATVKGGAGKYAKAKGTLKFTGNYNKTKGTFTVKFKGAITL